MGFHPVLALLIVLALLVTLPAAVGAQATATVELQPPASTPGEGQTFTTDVVVKGVEGLLGFQFDVNFDPAQLAVESIALGPFIGSTGRAPQPLGPDTRDAASGRVVYGGFTLGQPDQQGAAGDGVLATITWRVVKPAEFNAALSHIQLVGAGGQALPVVQAEVTPRSPGAPAGEATQAAAPAPTAVAAQAGATEETGASSGVPAWALIALVLVVIVIVLVLFAVRRRGAKSP